MLIETTYQPFISLFHQTEMVKSHPELEAIRKSPYIYYASSTQPLSADFGSAIAIELRRAPPPDARDFLRFKFRNGTSEDFRTVHVFKHREDIPLTEFIYRLENSVISSNREWAQACSIGAVDTARESLGLPESATTGSTAIDAMIGVSMAVVILLAMFFAVKVVRRRGAVRLSGPEVLATRVSYGTKYDIQSDVPRVGDPLSCVL